MIPKEDAGSRPSTARDRRHVLRRRVAHETEPAPPASAPGLMYAARPQSCKPPVRSRESTSQTQQDSRPAAAIPITDLARLFCLESCEDSRQVFRVCTSAIRSERRTRLPAGRILPRLLNLPILADKSDALLIRDIWELWANVDLFQNASIVQNISASDNALAKC